MVSFYAVESVSKYYNLAGDCLSDGTVSDLLRYFYEQRHITKAQFEAKKFDMMLVVKHTELVFTIFPLYFGDLTSSIKFPDSGFQRRISSSVPSSKRPARSSSRNSTRESIASSFSSTGAASGERESSSQKTRNIRLSAWRKPAAASQFARNPPAFIEYNFKRLVVKVVGTDVSISMPGPNAPMEKILVASDWKAGLSISSSKTAKNAAEEIHKTGFIGRGSSKNVVYVSLRIVACTCMR
jgi:hypothetical protein